MFKICRDGHVIVYDQPDAIDSPEARRPTHPQVGRVTASQCAPYVVEAMNEGQFAVRRDAQVPYLVGNRASVCGEEFFPGSTLIVNPGVSEGWIQIEGNDVGCIEGHHPVDVFRANRLRAVFYTLSNESFNHGFLLFNTEKVQLRIAAGQRIQAVFALLLPSTVPIPTFYETIPQITRPSRILTPNRRLLKNAVIVFRSAKEHLSLFRISHKGS